MLNPYNVAAWYWIVAGDESKVYSSAAATYVSATDTAYLVWVDTGFYATRIASEAELRDVFAQQYPAGWPGCAPISPRQIRMALSREGLRAAVEAAVAAGDQDTKDWWEYSTVFERNHQKVAEMAAALKVTDGQVDALWALGTTL